MGRTLAATVLPALAIALGWLRLEEPVRVGEALAIVLLALVPALVPRWWQRGLALLAATGAAVWLASGVKPWEHLPFRGEPVVEPLVRALSHGVGEYYGVTLPFEPDRHPEMHTLLLVAIFGFVAAMALFVAARAPLAAAAVTLAGVCWPATIVDAGAVAIGVLALAAALSIFLALRVRSFPALVAGVATAAAVISGAAWASTATTFAQNAVLDWESWDFRGLPARALGVRFVWDANYDGIAFPTSQTVVLEIQGPERAQYWRVSTLDRFSADRWIEQLLPRLIGPGDRDVPQDALAPRRSRNRESWLEQRVEVKALVDDRIAAAGTPVALGAGSVGTVFYLDGGVIRARRSLTPGTRYRVWSYVPDPRPAALARAPARYPGAVGRYLTVWGRTLPTFGSAARDARVRAVLSDPQYRAFGEYRPLYDVARRVTAEASSPYEAVLALEEWFRRGGGFRYDEQPPRAAGLPPLVHFVTVSKVGYCQHYAGAMAVMLRMLGVPARVAVGFTSGTLQDGVWRVTDHNAHAWVEVWFPGHGWVAFDPTPGRGTFAGTYSFASESSQAVALLGRGDLEGLSGLEGGRPFTEREAVVGRPPVTPSSPPSLFSLVLLLGMAGVATIGGAKWSLRRARYLTSDPRRLAAASRRELEGFLRDQGVELPPTATLDDLRRALADETGLDCRRFVDAAGRGRFGSPQGAPRNARAARRELRSLLRRVRRELSIWARLRGFVSLRSVRGT